MMTDRSSQPLDENFPVTLPEGLEKSEPIPRPFPVEPALPEIVPSIRRCPRGFTPKVVQNGQSFTDLLIENDVSYDAMRAANPFLSTRHPIPGTRYCAPPGGSRQLCPENVPTYILQEGDSLDVLSFELGIDPGAFLLMNPSLAPTDFIPGRVICLP